MSRVHQFAQKEYSISADLISNRAEDICFHYVRDGKDCTTSILTLVKENERLANLIEDISDWKKAIDCWAAENNTLEVLVKNKDTC